VAKRTKKAATKERGTSVPRSFSTLEPKKRKISKAEKERRSEAAKRGWETRRAAERKRLEALERRRERDRARREAAREAARRAEEERLRKLEQKRARDRERQRKKRAEERAKKEEAERLRKLEEERLRKLEEKRARDRERQRKKRAEEKRKKEEAERKKALEREKRRVCEDLERDPSPIPEIAWGSDCFLLSRHFTFKDGTFEGLIYAEPDPENPDREWRRLERFLRAFWAQSEGWWIRVGVFGLPPEELAEDFAGQSDYQPAVVVPGRPDLVGSVGSFTRWRRVGPTRGKRTQFVTAASQYVIGRRITEAFLDQEFQGVTIAVACFTGKEPPA